VTIYPFVMVVRTETPYKSVEDLMVYARANPGKLNYGSSGIGSQTHLSGAYFANRTGVTLTHVPYRSASEVVSDLVTNRIQSVFVPAAFLFGQIQSGKVRALAVAGTERLPTLRDVPTTAEAGVRGVEPPKRMSARRTWKVRAARLWLVRAARLRKVCAGRWSVRVARW